MMDCLFIRHTTHATTPYASLTGRLLIHHTHRPAHTHTHTGIKKNEPKVVDAFSVADIEDMVKKNKDGVVALCRCWRSSTFPLCDGTHNTFNKTSGENIGPCLIKKKK